MEKYTIQEIQQIRDVLGDLIENEPPEEFIGLCCYLREQLYYEELSYRFINCFRVYYNDPYLYPVNDESPFNDTRQFFVMWLLNMSNKDILEVVNQEGNK